MAYSYDRARGRYRDAATGRFISDRTVRDSVDNLADLASRRMVGYARDLLDGRMSLADWQARMQADVKAAHVAAGIAAHGGKAQMSQADWGRIGQRVRAEYGYLRGFAQDIASGRQPLNGTLPARASQYGQASRVTYEHVKGGDDRARGMRWERNILHGRDHCSLCPTLSEKGWVPIGTLPPIGSRPCRSLDRCTIERRLVAPQPS